MKEKQRVTRKRESAREKRRSFWIKIEKKKKSSVFFYKGSEEKMTVLPIYLYFIYIFILNIYLKTNDKIIL